MQIYLKLDSAFENKNKKKEALLSFDLTDEHQESLEIFYRDITDAIHKNWPILAECGFQAFFSNKPIPPSGQWDTSRIKPAANMELKIKLTKKAAAQVTQGIGAAIQGLSKSKEKILVVPCSCIDDTHKGQSGSRKIASGRYLNIDEIQRQQKLDRVVSALENKEKFALVLIDPGFAGGGSHQKMVQIVEYLGQHSEPTYTFSSQRLANVNGVTFACGKVTITYIAEEVDPPTETAIKNVASWGSI